MLALFIIALSCLGIYKLSISAWQLATFEREQATIISCDARVTARRSKSGTIYSGTSYHPVAQRKNGSTITGSTGVPKSQCSNQIDESVTVLIDKESESSGVVYTLVQFWLLPIIIIIFLYFVWSIGRAVFGHYRKT
jgi:hypothetical protein